MISSINNNIVSISYIQTGESVLFVKPELTEETCDVDDILEMSPRYLIA